MGRSQDITLLSNKKDPGDEQGRAPHASAFQPPWWSAFRPTSPPFVPQPPVSGADDPQLYQDIQRGLSIDFYADPNPRMSASWATFFRDQYLRVIGHTQEGKESSAVPMTRTYNGQQQQEQQEVEPTLPPDVAHYEDASWSAFRPTLPPFVPQPPVSGADGPQLHQDIQRGLSIDFYADPNPLMVASWATFFRDQHLRVIGRAQERRESSVVPMTQKYNGKQQQGQQEVDWRRDVDSFITDVMASKVFLSPHMERVFRQMPFSESKVGTFLFSLLVTGDVLWLLVLPAKDPDSLKSRTSFLKLLLFSLSRARTGLFHFCLWSHFSEGYRSSRTCF
jgi:hypothetical protein